MRGARAGAAGCDRSGGTTLRAAEIEDEFVDGTRPGALSTKREDVTAGGALPGPGPDRARLRTDPRFDLARGFDVDRAPSPRTRRTRTPSVMRSSRRCWPMFPRAPWNRQPGTCGFRGRSRCAKRRFARRWIRPRAASALTVSVTSSSSVTMAPLRPASGPSPLA